MGRPVYDSHTSTSWDAKTTLQDFWNVFFPGAMVPKANFVGVSMAKNGTKEPLLHVGIDIHMGDLSCWTKGTSQFIIVAFTELILEFLECFRCGGWWWWLGF